MFTITQRTEMCHNSLTGILTVYCVIFCCSLEVSWNEVQKMKCATSNLFFSQIHTKKHLFRCLDKRWDKNTTGTGLNRLILRTDCMSSTYFPTMARALVRTLTRHELWHLGCSQCRTLIDLEALLTSWTKKKKNYRFLNAKPFFLLCDHIKLHHTVCVLHWPGLQASKILKSCIIGSAVAHVCYSFEGTESLPQGTFIHIFTTC